MLVLHVLLLLKYFSSAGIKLIGSFLLAIFYDNVWYWSSYDRNKYMEVLNMLYICMNFIHMF